MTAVLEQHSAGGPFGVGRRIWGTLAASDAGFFGALTIPRLVQNDGSKTGAALNCDVAIHVPVDPNVTDDNRPQPPERIALVGTVTAYGKIVGDERRSAVIMAEEPGGTPRRFGWTGVRQ